MSILLVWKGKSACIVDKGRDPGHKGKYIEKYLGSLGTISKSEMEGYRARLKDVKNPDRMRFIQSNFRVIEERKKNLPSHKAAIGDIREQKQPKERKARVKKVKGVRWVPIPKSHITHTEIMREREGIKKEIAASKPKDIKIPDNIKTPIMQKRFLKNLKVEYQKDIEESNEGIRQEEIRMPPSLNAQRKEKIVIAIHKGDIRLSEGMIKRIDRQIDRM